MNAYDVRPFADSLDLGRHAEAQVREMLEGKGWRTWDTAAHQGEVLRVNQWRLELAPAERGRGPRWVSGGRLLLAADVLAAKDGRTILVEVKRKLQGCQWNRTHGSWVTGCDERSFVGYIRAEQALSIPHSIVFQHARRRPDPRGGVAPHGWHAATVSHLRNIGGPPCQETRGCMPRLAYFWAEMLRAM